MKLFYINETMLQDNAFSKNVMQRFLNYYYRHHGEILCISAIGPVSLDSIPKDIHYVLSPSFFDFQGVKGTVYPHFLQLENIRLEDVFSGTCIQFDTETYEVKRIYFDIVDDPLIDLTNQIMDEIHNLLGDYPIKKHFLN